MIFIRLSVCALLASSLLSAQEEWRLALNRIRMSVQLAISRTDNYICAQDVSRFYYPAAKDACRDSAALPTHEPMMQDRLKLDVAVSEGKEIYSWHGENKFSAATVSDIVRSGPISTGSFTGYLRNIFAEGGIVFTYRGQSRTNGLNLYHFDYEVPLKSSHYEMQAGKGYVMAPFHGSFSAMVETSQLYSLSVLADEEQIPNKSSICAAQSRLTYQVVRIGSHPSLIPSTFDLVMGTRDGIRTDSKGAYTQCREYSGESTVRFDDVAAADTKTKALELHSEPLKDGLFLPIALQSVIDEESAYAGEPLEAELKQNVKVSKQMVLHRGAILKGTLTQFEIYNEPNHGVALRFEFTSITDGDNLYLCDAVPYVEPDFLPVYSGGGRGRLATRLQTSSRGEPDGSLHIAGLHVRLDHRYSARLVTGRYRSGAAE